MNEHVEKFARECGAWNQVYGNRTFMIDEHFDLKKFAQLIVRECVSIADEYDGVGSTIVSRIREHFGVEE
jgi:hypothetical protein